MYALYFRGRPRLAARQILDNTALGDRLDDHIVDDGELLTIDAPAEVIWRLSTGELHLYGALESITGDRHARTSLFDLVNGVDPDAAWCVWWAIGVLLDKVTPMQPEQFGGLRDVVGRPS